MKNKIAYLLCILSLPILFVAFKSSSSADGTTIKTTEMKEVDQKYWDEGLAEVSRYSLKQNRYQDLHPGEVIIVFVKEDFLTDKQVKNELYTNKNSTPVLKQIQIKKFLTGIYDYTLSTNIFTSFDQIQFPGSIKLQHVASEWCGTSYVQLNRSQDKYKVELRSYFEREGDDNFDVKRILLEDELLSMIRLDPEQIQTGSSQMIPSMEYCRLMHKSIEPSEVNISLSKYNGSEFDSIETSVLSVEFPEANRIKQIYFESNYPHSILGWDDRYPSAFDGQLRETSARRTHMIRDAYWNKNKLSDKKMRARLGLGGY